MSAEKKHPFAAIVLAAGAGTRYGEPKAGATLPDGRRFLEAVVEGCVTSGADPVIAVVPPGTDVPPGVSVGVIVSARRVTWCCGALVFFFIDIGFPGACPGPGALARTGSIFERQF